MTQYPKIYLTMDNSFATKRWTKPDEWARVIRELGVSCVEASADTEADPFYCGEDYLLGGSTKVLRRPVEARRAGGQLLHRLHDLSHSRAGAPRPRHQGADRERLAEGDGPHCLAGQGGAGILHPRLLRERAAGSCALRRRARRSCTTTWPRWPATRGRSGRSRSSWSRCTPRTSSRGPSRGRFATCARSHAAAAFPHTWPWTRGTRQDSGCSSGPTREPSSEALAGQGPEPYLGPDSAFASSRQAPRRRPAAQKDAVARIETEMDRFPHLFARRADCDLYGWLQRWAATPPSFTCSRPTGCPRRTCPSRRRTTRRASCIRGRCSRPLRAPTRRSRGRACRSAAKKST